MLLFRAEQTALGLEGGKRGVHKRCLGRARGARFAVPPRTRKERPECSEAVAAGGAWPVLEQPLLLSTHNTDAPAAAGSRDGQEESRPCACPPRRAAYKAVMLGYAGVCALWIPLIAWMMPNDSFKASGWLCPSTAASL